ncbi:leucyl aminopeptidase family protein [Arenimonas alkanexedens]
MSLPSCFARPDAAAATTPLRLVERASFAAWRETQPATTQAWLDAHGAGAGAIAPLAIPGADGRPLFVLVTLADATDPLALAHLPSLLPMGRYRLCPDSPAQLAPGQALLGWGLGAYRFNRYLKPAREPAQLELDSLKGANAEALALLDASYLVRNLINTPTEHMGPDEIEATAARMAQDHGARLDVITGEALLTENFPAIHAVGRASHRAPRLVELNWGDDAHLRLAIVGKGVCFDTGGLDIKGSDGMRNMKKDMGGAAHALGLAQLVMALKLPVRLQLLVPAVENAIGPNAFRPGEVLATRQGLSVEVDNTDAEGRLVLCDALTYAAESKPALLMDFATLTGAARIALGPDLPALFANDDALANDYLAAGQRARDPLWRMPLWRPYLSYLKSGIADLANSGGSRMAGCITAAVYLERFVPEGQVWTHVDVYSWNDSERPGKPAGGEAQGLRAAWGLLQQRFGHATPA